MRSASARIGSASAAFVPTIRTTIGTSRVSGPAGLDDPASDLVAARDAAEDVDEDRPDVRVVEDDPERGGHAIRLGAAADVEEVRRLATGKLDKVHRRHRQARPVDHAPDRAVELDEADAGLAGGDLRWLLLVEVAHRLELRVARERRVVEDDLRVEREQPAVIGDDQRVDLGQVGVRFDEGPIQPAHDQREVLAQLGRDAEEEADPPHLVLLEPDQWVERMPEDRLRIRSCGLLDLDSALGARDHGDRPRRAVEDEPEVVLLRDLGGRRDQHGLDRRALDVETDDLARPLLRLRWRGRQLHAARLATPADEDLGLDDDRAADALGSSAGALGGRGGLAIEERHAVAREDLLAPMLLELHAGLLMRSCGNGASARGSARAVTGGDCSEAVPDAGRHLFRRSSGR